MEDSSPFQAFMSAGARGMEGRTCRINLTLSTKVVGFCFSRRTTLCCHPIVNAVALDRSEYKFTLTMDSLTFPLRRRHWRASLVWLPPRVST
ncbi:hypothetical protein DPMN_033809 [Dreissena polymorpha]|uniref:Uncharacterized protein n=1 Tax=Dreissena polymorpha TaxID=45954 RepID=A0A9D4M6Q7_DREPO|nr:hypothetical protein DPMN_033809 [Dreissena polymorpha]